MPWRTTRSCMPKGGGDGIGLATESVVLRSYSAIARAALIASTIFECIRHSVGPRITITQRLQSPAVFDQRQDRCRVIAVVIDEMALGERRDDQRRHPDARAPAVDDGRRDVVPEAAMLVVRDDDRRGRPVGSVPNRIDQMRAAIS